MTAVRRLMMLVRLFERWRAPEGWTMVVTYAMGGESHAIVGLTAEGSTTAYQVGITPAMTRQDVAHAQRFLETACLREFFGIEDSPAIQAAADAFETSLCLGA